jgi:hypothetical protein
MSKFSTFCLLVIFTEAVASAETYRHVTVTRDRPNLYAVDGGRQLLDTISCHPIGSRLPAIIRWRRKGSSENEITFTDQDGKVTSKCRIRRILVEGDL